MNVLGHASVAVAVREEDPAFVLGAVLPDLASMARVRLGHAPAGTLAEGIRCHVAADTAFHGSATFRAGSGALRRALLDAGLPTGPARAVGHAGWELLLDGTLLGSPVEAAYRRALGHGALAVDAVRAEDRDRWLAFVGRWSQPPPLRYDDPSWVADRLFGMLDHRPRLRLPPDQVPTVAAVLDRHAPAVRAAADTVLAEVATLAG